MCPCGAGVQKIGSVLKASYCKACAGFSKAFAQIHPARLGKNSGRLAIFSAALAKPDGKLPRAAFPKIIHRNIHALWG